MSDLPGFTKQTPIPDVDRAKLRAIADDLQSTCVLMANMLSEPDSIPIMQHCFWISHLAVRLRELARDANKVATRVSKIGGLRSKNFEQEREALRRWDEARKRGA